MKKEETPQDNSALNNISRELYYVKNNDGKYDTSSSTGWNIKQEALDNAWDGIHEDIENARKVVELGRKSPIYYYMKKNLMNISLLSSYVKYSKIRVWWHLRPSVYKKLNTHILQRYAKVFSIELDELNTLK